MSKFLSKTIGFILGAVLIGVGIATGNVALIISGAELIVAQAVYDLTAPKAPSRTAAEMTLQLGEQPRVALFGETFTPGSLVDAFNYGGKYGTDWEVLVIRLADHKCDSLTSFFVNDQEVTYTGDGVYPQFDTHHFELYFRSDTSTQTMTSVVTTNGPGWTSDDIGQSGCDVVVAYLADKPDAKHPAWPGGRPRFGFVVKGKLCYDPRLDDTVGGTGTHRWDDPATWEWSENPAVCRYNWVRGIYANDAVDDQTALLIGRGLTAEEAPPENIFAPANLCDETVGSGVRYRIAGPIYANQRFLDVEEMFASATGGSVVTREGSVELEPGQSKSVVATITDDDLLVGSKANWNQRILSESDGTLVNTVVANYVEPAQQWQPHDAPVVRNSSDIISDGGPKEATLQLRLVKDVDQAQRVAEINRRLGRLWGRMTITLGPRFCELEEGDWIDVQSDRRFGGDTITFRILAYTIDERWQITLTLGEINADVFDGAFAPDTDHSVVTVTTPPPDVGEPDSGNWALAAVLLTDASGIQTPALRVTGDTSDDDSVESVIVEHWKDDGVGDPVADPDSVDWTSDGAHPPSAAFTLDIPGVEGGADYYAAVTYVVSGIPGDRLVLGPVTAGSTDISGAVNPLVDAKTALLSWKQPVRAKTTAALAANTYANGSSGVGATLTANANGALAAQDGVTLVAGNRLLVANESTGSRNGIYVVTQVGTAGTPYILTRATDADTSAKLVNATCKISEGTVAADQEWQCKTNATITVGTTALAWEPASSLRNALVAGTNVTITDNGDGTYTVASSGGGGGPTLIEEYVADGTTGTHTFSSISGSYRELRLVWVARSDVSATSELLFLQFNGDTGSNYDYEIARTFGTTSNGLEGLAQTSAAVGLISGDTSPAGAGATGECSIPYYAGTTYQKSGFAIGHGKLANSTGNIQHRTFSFWWRNTAAITSITAALASGKYKAGSKLALYGVS